MRFLLIGLIFRCDITTVSIRWCLIDGAARYAFPDAADANTLQKFPIYSSI